MHASRLRPAQRTNRLSRRRLARLLGIGLLGGGLMAGNSGCHPPTTPPPHRRETALEYPPARRVDQVDDYHGHSVADPYRWLEDSDSPETRRWIEAENQLTESYLSAIGERARIRQRLAELWNYEKFGLPVERGGRTFFTKNDGLQNQPVLYVQEGIDGTPRPLVDPNQLAADGTVAFSGWEPSPDGKHLAYGLATAGSDWQQWRVREVESATDLPDHLRWIKFSGVSWTPDGTSFYYSRYDQPAADEELTGTNYFQKLYQHRLGTPQTDDVLVYHRPDEKEWGFDGQVTDDGQYLIISVWRGAERKNCLFLRDLSQNDAPVRELIAGFDAEYDFVGNQGPLLYIRTDRDAARGQLLSLRLVDDGSLPERVVIPETDREVEGRMVLESVTRVGDRFFARYLDDAHTTIRVFDLSGARLSQVELPGIGTATGFDGRPQDTETFFSFTTFTSPAAIYRYELANGQTSLFRQPRLKYDPTQYRVEQVFYKSRDGMEIPLFLARRAGQAPRGEQPCYLYGYGGFNIPLTPAFSVQNLVWMELGGLYAQANLRGGGEYGRTWHEAGMRFQKQNVFDDFQSAAKFLISKGYTTNRRLAIGGRSNGGLLVGACLTQAPYLFGAAVPAVGVMDMLRFHRFTIGWAWVPEYGSADNPNDFNNLFGYSPLHNIRPGAAYPPTLITTADHDDRVVPAHSFKFAAALQAAQSDAAPILIRIETSAGHGAGLSTDKALDEAADVLAFLTHTFQMKVLDGGP